MCTMYAYCCCIIHIQLLYICVFCVMRLARTWLPVFHLAVHGQDAHLEHHGLHHAGEHGRGSPGDAHEAQAHRLLADFR